jgi:hypothetical protein
MLGKSGISEEEFDMMFAEIIKGKLWYKYKKKKMEYI